MQCEYKEARERSHCHSWKPQSPQPGPAVWCKGTTSWEVPNAQEVSTMEGKTASIQDTLNAQETSNAQEAPTGHSEAAVVPPPSRRPLLPCIPPCQLIFTVFFVLLLTRHVQSGHLLLALVGLLLFSKQHAALPAHVWPSCKALEGFKTSQGYT